jgi:aryl-alcohol dehydrogenase-like predicted oxidoreductase
MKLHPLGSTHLQVSSLGLGLAALGRPGYINLGHAEDLHGDYALEEMQANAHVVLDAAYQAGVRYFDAARSYGRAEQFLGSWLRSREIPSDSVVVASKWGYTYTAGWQVNAEIHEIKEHSLAVLQRQWSETQANLGGYLDLYQIHSATLKSGVLENPAVLAELARLKETGTAIGLTVSGPRQAEVVERAIRVEVGGKRLFDSVQATWNLLERSTGAALRRAKAAGLGVIIKEALANGRLTDKNHDPVFAEKLERLQRQAKRLDTSLDALALAIVLSQPWVDLVLSGAARVEHLTSNLRALDLRLDEHIIQGLDDLVEPADVYWQKRSDLEWN